MPGWGEITLSALLVALLSGAMLIPLIPAGSEAFSSLSQLAGLSSGHLLHSVHSYSGDLFLFGMAMHVWEYLYKKVHRAYRLPDWMWLVLLGVVSVLVVFSGFLSIGSKESGSAIAIFRGIAGQLSVPGETINRFLFGGTHGTAIYVHHASTFTMLTVVLTYVHIRRIKPERYTFFYSLAILLVLSMAVPAFIGHTPDSVIEVVKGPWYFIGLQEMLSWLPVWLAGIVIPLGFTVLFLLLPLSAKADKQVLVLLTLLLLFYLIEMSIGLYLRGAEWQFLWR
jgi:ubiquinol-cytochrome c reductase cytochrome b subunit